MRQIILSVTAASLFGAVALALVPDGALKEAVRLGVGIVLVLSLVLPLRAALPPALSEFVPEAAEVQQETADDVYRAAIREQVEAQTAAYIEQAAADGGIACTAQVTADIAQDGTVSIAAVSIRAADADRARALRERLSEELGVPVSSIRIE